MGAIERLKGSTAPEGRNESEGGFLIAIIVECFTIRPSAGSKKTVFKSDS
jgi:hypothetical protein